MFGRGFQLFRIFGIPIKLDVTFLIVLPLFTWIIGSRIAAGTDAFEFPVDVGPMRGQALPYVVAFIIVIGLFISVLIHELGHALTARAYGVRTRSITLWLLGGVAQLERMPRQRGAEAVVAIVGPIVSFVLGLLFGLAFIVTPEVQQTGISITRYILMYLASINVVLAVFNLLPALPLDGGRVLRSLLALKMQPMHATQLSGAISKGLALLLGLAGFMFWQPWLMLIAFFIYMAVNAETQQTMIEYMLRGLRVRDLMNRKVVTVDPDATVHDLMMMMVRERHLGFPVQRDGELFGLIDLANVQGLPPEMPIGQVMQREISTIREDEEALEAFTRMSGSGFGRLIVVDQAGRMVGIITKTDLMRAIQIRLAASAPREATAVREQFEAAQPEPRRVMP